MGRVDLRPEPHGQEREHVHDLGPGHPGAGAAASACARREGRLQVLTGDTQPAAAASSVEVEVQRSRGLVRARRFGEALVAAGSLRTVYPENRDVLYLLAFAQRHTARFQDALDTLADMQRHHPSASRLYQERGHCYVALKDAPRAIEGYEHRVRINPALPDTWGMLEGLYKLIGDDPQRQVAASHAQKLKSVPPEVITAIGM